MLEHRANAGGRPHRHRAAERAGGIVSRPRRRFRQQLLDRRSVLAVVVVPQEAREAPILRVERFDAITRKLHNIAGVQRDELLEAFYAQNWGFARFLWDYNNGQY